MQTLGLGSADFQRYLDACAQPHDVYVSVDLRDQNGTVIVSFDQGRAGGRDVITVDSQVDVDADSLVGRVLTLGVSDWQGVLRVGQDANFINRQLRVSVGIPVPALSQVVWADVFTGPIVNAPRSGDVIQFTAHGKARYAQHGIQDTYTVPKGTPKTTAVKRLLNVLAGEPYVTMGGVPDLAPVLSDDLVLHLADRPWGICRSLMDDMTRHLQFDGSGQLRAQRTDLQTPVYTFQTGFHGGVILAPEPEIQSDWSTVKNAVRVTGGATKTNPAPVAIADANVEFPTHPYTPKNLGRNGADAYLWDFLTVDTVHTQATAQSIADNLLARDLRGNRAIKFESMPMYVFDELDLIQVDSNEVSTQTQLSKFTIPLNLDGAPSMSYGFNQRVSSNRFARRK